MKPESSGIGQRLKVQPALLLLMKNTRSVGQCQVSGPALLNAPLQSTRLTRIKKELLCQDANNKRLWACQSRLSFQAAHHRHKESSISCYVQQIPSGWFFFSTCVKVCVCAVIWFKRGQSLLSASSPEWCWKACSQFLGWLEAWESFASQVLLRIDFLTKQLHLWSTEACCATSWHTDILTPWACKSELAGFVFWISLSGFVEIALK